MDADFIKIEEVVEQADIPVSRAARTDMAENLWFFRREILGAKRGHRARPHVGDPGSVDDGLRRSVGGVEKVQQRHFGRQAAFVVIDEIADHFHARDAMDDPAQHVEMAIGDARFQMHPGFDHRLATPCGDQAALDRVKNVVIG